MAKGKSISAKASAGNTAVASHGSGSQTVSNSITIIATGKAGNLSDARRVVIKRKK